MTRNVAASVRQRLLNISKSDKRPFGEILQYYAMERFLFRLSQSKLRDRFILKGALLLSVWEIADKRATMDIDLLGQTSNAEQTIRTNIREIIQAPIEDDGLLFDPASITIEPIDEDGDYSGLRVKFKGELSRARVHMQIDIGFGDQIHPSAKLESLPVILDHPTPDLFCYSKESVIAEKFEAMIKLSMLNSRMKDFFDIWILSRCFDFDGQSLAQAVEITLTNRKTILPTNIAAFSTEFVNQKQVQWTAFSKRQEPNIAPANFSEVVSHIAIFLTPVCKALSTVSVRASASSQT